MPSSRGSSRPRDASPVSPERQSWRKRRSQQNRGIRERGGSGEAEGAGQLCPAPLEGKGQRAGTPARRRHCKGLIIQGAPPPLVKRGEGAVGRRVSAGGAGGTPEERLTGSAQQCEGPGKPTFPNSARTGLPGADLPWLWAAFHHGLGAEQGNILAVEAAPQTRAAGVTFLRPPWGTQMTGLYLTRNTCN